MSEVIQLSPEWFALRAGKFTASRFNALMSKGRGNAPSKTRESYLYDVAVERITGTKLDSYTNDAMQRGIDMEAEARMAYEDHVMAPVTETGIVIHPSLDYVSCSPDGLVRDGLVEIKCMGAKNHTLALLRGQHAIDFKWQLQGQMWVCDKTWCDIVGYHPEFIADGWDRRLAITGVERDEEMIEALEAECIKANEEVNAIVEQLKGENDD